MDNVARPGSRPPDNAYATLHDVGGEAATRLTDAFLVVLAACDDELFSRAENSSSGTVQAQYFDDLRALRRAGPGASRAFQTACNDSVREWASGASAAPRPASAEPGSELQLVEEADLEFDLALNRIGARFEDASPNLASQVRQRLMALAGRDDATGMPLSAAAIARACKAAMSLVQLSMESRLIVLKRLELGLAEKAESVLEAINAQLVERGVLPNLRSARPNRAATPARGAPGTVASGEAGDGGGGETVEQVDLHTRLTQWLMRQAGSGGTAAVAPAPVVAAAPLGAAATAEERERRRLEIIERRNAEMARAKEMREAAGRNAETVINAALEADHMPGELGAALREPMRRHLETVYSRRGETSGEWRRARKLVHDLAWSLDPETLRHEKGHWEAIRPRIVSALAKALSSVGVQDHEAERLIVAFARHQDDMLDADLSHAAVVPAVPPATPPPTVKPAPATTQLDAATESMLASLVGETFVAPIPTPAPAPVVVATPTAPVAAPTPPSPTVAPPARPAPAPADAAAAPVIVDKPKAPERAAAPAAAKAPPVPTYLEATRRVATLMAGQWFELQDDAGQTVRGKLVWTSAATERCLFVNANGKLIAERPYARIAKDIVSGTFREVDPRA